MLRDMQNYFFKNITQDNLFREICSSKYKKCPKVFVEIYIYKSMKIDCLYCSHAKGRMR